MSTMNQYQRQRETETLPVRRRPNSEYRSRKYLTLDEVTRLIEVAKVRRRYGVRDHALLLMMFRHGLRATEAATMQWDMVMLSERRVVIHRLKHGTQGNHPLQDDEVATLAALREAYPNSPYLFPNERGDHITREAVAQIVRRCGALAELSIGVHAQMLRNSCASHLENQGLDTHLIYEWLGFYSTEYMARYSQINPGRFDQIRWT